MAVCFWVAGFICIQPLMAAAPPDDKILESRLAGSWYPADPAQLKKELQDYLDRAKPPEIPDLIGLILPHAGYRFSGQTAAYGIDLLKGRSCKRVIILGPSHRIGMENRVSVSPWTLYRTPLGDVPLDTAMIEKIRKFPWAVSLPQAHATEHSVQMEIPLLQMVLKDFRIVPIVVGQLDEATALQIGHDLAGLMDPETLVIASSDFTHFGPDYGYEPFHDQVEENLKKLDMGAFHWIQQKNLPEFLRYLDKTGATICGRCSISVLLAMLPADTKVSLLHYDTSGHLMNNFTNSVSYVSAAFSGHWPATAAMPSDPKPSATEATAEKTSPAKTDVELTSTDRENLLKMARKTVEYVFKNRKKPTASDLGIEVTPGMKQVMGAFVTLHENGELRGCIGEIIPRRPLYEAVIDQAVNAAFNDYRFPALSEKELPSVDFEISALTPSKPVASYKDIRIGVNGMTLSKDGRSAVFLPQVAPEQGWNLEQTLSHLAQKAGLPSDDWKSGATFTVFEAIVFGEKKEK